MRDRVRLHAQPAGSHQLGPAAQASVFNRYGALPELRWPTQHRDLRRRLHCRGKLKIIAAILESEVIERILTHLWGSRTSQQPALAALSGLQGGLPAAHHIDLLQQHQAHREQHGGGADGNTLVAARHPGDGAVHQGPEDAGKAGGKGP